MRRIFLLSASVSLAVLLASGVALAVTPLGDTSEKIDADTTTAASGPDAALDRALKKLVAMPGGPPGIIAVVQRGQSREVHTFGVANLSNGRRMGVNDRMRIASTAKAFSGAVALSLVSKTDKLSLDDTIGDRLSDLPEPPPKKWSDVTLRQLLNHTSGLPDYTGEAFRTADEEGRLRHPDPPEKLLTYTYGLDNGDLLCDPGSRYQYSNSDNVAGP